MELLAVVTLLGLTAALLSLRLQGATEAARLRQARLELETTLRTARHWSRAHHAPSRIEIDAEHDRWRWLRAAGNAPTQPWRAIPGVEFEQGERRDAGWTGAASRGDSIDRPLVIRIRPSGATIPWEIRLCAGVAELELQHDGFSDVLRTVAGVRR